MEPKLYHRWPLHVASGLGVATFQQITPTSD